jgi:hypothetical protein
MSIQFPGGNNLRVAIKNFYGYPQLTAKYIKSIFTIFWNVTLKI